MNYEGKDLRELSTTSYQKNLIVTVVMFVSFLAGCAMHQPMPKEDMTIRTELAAPGLSRGQIFEKSITWLTRHLYSPKKIIVSADSETGVIIANGSIEYPATGELEAIERIQYTISFTMREDIEDAKILLTFDNLLLDVPRYYRHSRFWPEEQYGGGYSIPIEQRADFEAARKGLLGIAGKLAEYLKQ